MNLVDLVDVSLRGQNLLEWVIGPSEEHESVQVGFTSALDELDDVHVTHHGRLCTLGAIVVSLVEPSLAVTPDRLTAQETVAAQPPPASHEEVIRKHGPVQGWGYLDGSIHLLELTNGCTFQLPFR